MGCSQQNFQLWWLLSCATAFLCWTPATAIDTCRNNDAFMQSLSFQISCFALKGGLVPGLSCASLGAACPLSCGLCETLGRPAECTTTEIYENKRPLAQLVRDMGACPNCEATEPNASSEMVWTEKFQTAAGSFPMGGYSTSDPNDPCGIWGVSCDRCGVVTDLSIGFPSGQPLLPFSEAIFELYDLRAVVVMNSEPQLPADAPWLPGDAWARLENLVLFWAVNMVKGDMPNFSNHTHLSVVVLRSAEVDGDINDLGTASLRLYSAFALTLLGEEAQTGVQLSDKFCNIPNLINFRVGAGLLSGSLPPCFARHDSLGLLHLQGNPRLSGNIGDLLNSPGSLHTFEVAECNFSGTFPDQLSQHTALTKLDVRGNSVSGTLPDLSQLSNLETLSLQANRLTGANGTIGHSEGEVEMVASFAGNLFEALPSGWITMPGVTSLDLSENRISVWPPAGLYPRRFVSDVGSIRSCLIQPQAPAFNWPKMKSVTLAGNPMHGIDVRTVLGSLAPLSTVQVVDISRCDLVEDLPNEGSLVPEVNAVVCGQTYARASFVSLTTLRASANAIQGVHAGPWTLLQQADFSSNNLSFFDSSWFDSSVASLQLENNPRLRLTVKPPSELGFCVSDDRSILQANPRAFASLLSPNPDRSECTTLCEQGATISTDPSINTSAMCRCSAGWYGSGIVCTEAQADTWAEAGSLLPTACPANSSTLGLSGQSSEDNCKCNAGFFPSYSAEGDLACRPCPANTVRALPGAVSPDNCEECEVGRFAATAGTQCELCPLGSVAAGGAGAGCRACDAGQFSTTQGETSCRSCPVGQYQGLSGQANCSECEGVAQSTWIQEPDGSYTLLAGATSASDCGCASGYFEVDGVCEACDVGAYEGLICPGGSNDVVLMRDGYYSDAPTISVYRCWGDDKRCPGSKPPGDACAEGRQGLTCAECGDGKIPADEGTCQDCGPASRAVFPVVIILATLAATALYYTMDRHSRGNIITQGFILLVTSLSSLSVTGIQQIGVISEMAHSWEAPLDGIVEVFKLFTFGVEALRLGCITAVKALDAFIIKLLMMFIFIILICVIHVVAVALGKRSFRQQRPALVSSVGAVLTLFYIAVVTTITGPFQCQSHPNGEWTCRAYPTVICWDSTTHTTMIVLSAIALLIPLAYTALVVWVVREYPKRVARAETDFMRSWSFLLIRFRSSTCWYAAVLVFKSLLISLIAAIPNTYFAVFMAALVLLACLIEAGHVEPWRCYVANFFDIGFSAGLIMLIFLGTHDNSHETDARRVLTWLYAIVLVGVFLLTPVAVILRFAFLKLHSTKRFAFFICHHKAGAGALARLLKTCLVNVDSVPKEVFLDCDNLENLEDLFTHVRKDVQTLVALSSADLLLRPWCAGEITVSRTTGVLVLPVRLPDYRELGEEVLKNYASHVNITALTEAGISTDTLQTCLQWYEALPAILVKQPPLRSGIESLTQTLRQWSLSPSQASAPTTVSSQEEVVPVSKVCILVDHQIAEVVATAVVLEKFLAGIVLQDASKSDFLPFTLPPAAAAAGEKSQHIPERVRVVVIMFSIGCFTSEAYVRLVDEAQVRRLRALPVLGQEAFRVPTLSEMQEMMSGNEAVVTYIMAVFKKIAKFFDAQYASESVLKLVADSIAAKILYDSAGKTGSSYRPGSSQDNGGSKTLEDDSGSQVPSRPGSQGPSRSASKEFLEPTPDLQRHIPTNADVDNYQLGNLVNLEI